MAGEHPCAGRRARTPAGRGPPAVGRGCAAHHRSGKQPFIIQKAQITRVQERKKDGVWDGIAAGLLYGFIMHVAYGDDSWTAVQTAGHYLGSAGLGAFIDWPIKGRRTVYRAP